MLKKMMLPFTLFFILFVFFGCAPKVKVAVKTELDQLFENNFEGLNVLEVTDIKAEGVSRSFPYATYDQVWDSIITILMQQEIIVRMSKDKGTIVVVRSYPPLAIFVDRSEPISVYLGRMWNLYNVVGDPKAVSPLAAIKNMVMAQIKEIQGRFFDKLAAQVYADEKWKYLYKSEKNYR